MAIKRYTANKDNTITNAFSFNLTTRGTGSNMGSADILEILLPLLSCLVLSWSFLLMKLAQTAQQELFLYLEVLGSS